MDKNTSIGVIFGIGIVIALAVALSSFPADSEDTIILVNKQGNDPVNSCAPGNGLILAQNLTDLCDVVIVSPVSEEVLKYNGTYWINQNESTSDVTSVTSNSNSTIGVVPTTGDVVLYPKYELLCQTTLASANTTVSCNNFEAMRYLHLQIFIRSINGTGIEPALRFNGDTGNNYAFRISTNGGADVTTTSTSRCNLFTTSGTLMASGNGQVLNINVYNNLSSERKIYDGIGSSGLNISASTAPNKNEVSCKWDNTTAQITSVTLIAFSGTGLYNTGSQLTIWGYN